jgi:succinate dehydrogenase / fumarate reductase flavoprotein subunit
MELAPRDLVSRSEQTEIEEGRGVGRDNQGVFLDMTHLGEEKIMKRLPQVHELAYNFSGVDIVKEPVPIQPTAHYSMGGIPANTRCEVLADANGSVVTGFYAAGECACISVHGANRLGTNSLLGASVFGRRAGQSMAEFVRGGAALAPVNGDPTQRNCDRIEKYKFAPVNGRGSAENVATIAGELKQMMTKDCGVFRNEERLSRAHSKVQELKERYRNARVMDKSTRFNNDLLAAIETEHLLTFSDVIVTSALARKESRGAHFRTDANTRNDDEWLKHTLAHKRDDGTPELSYKSVAIYWDRYPPQERKY